ncbi:hypothetical protein EVAR_45468_1 [Eumeta japonica]|uniref:Uncharacterized protein n=1 Tax=Eumeta variegata TaxID=151549 RepID=A0A4C1WEJ6_EUMVA|nr:hypothetical protein EVAR_45468_1 [Eumeta japonica]
MVHQTGRVTCLAVSSVFSIIELHMERRDGRTLAHIMYTVKSKVIHYYYFGCQINAPAQPRYYYFMAGTVELKEGLLEDIYPGIGYIQRPKRKRSEGKRGSQSSREVPVPAQMPVNVIYGNFT